MSTNITLPKVHSNTTTTIPYNSQREIEQLHQPLTSQEQALLPSEELDDRHKIDWLNSGVDKNTVIDLGVRSSLNKDSWVIPIFDITNTQLLGYKARYNEEMVEQNKYPNKDGKTPRYRTNKGFANRFFYPHLKNVNWTQIAKDPTIPIFITEGEKKAVKLTLEGYPCIGLPGINAWLTRKEVKTENHNQKRTRQEPVDDFKDIIWKGRVVYIVADNDKYFNKDIVREEKKLWDFLKKQLGCDCRIIDLPPDINAKGVDDFFVKHHLGANNYFLELMNNARTSA